MADLAGIYRAKASKKIGATIQAFIPQVFGDIPITIRDFVGTAPAKGTMGWVSFQGGNCEFPVWYGNIDQTTADARYVNTNGDAMTDTLSITRTTGISPNFITNRTGAAAVDGAIHMSIRSAGTEIGRITQATSGTAGYLTTSDEDLKENITEIDDDSVHLWMRTITPYFFNYKGIPDVRHVGYSAQRVAAQWPNGVSNGIITRGHGNVEERTWDESGNETTPSEVWESWMMDHSKITPILHACLKTIDRTLEERGQILDEVEARLTALEAITAANEAKIAVLETTVATQATQITALQATTATHTGQINANTTQINTHTTQIAALEQSTTNLEEADYVMRSDVFYTRRFVAYWQFSNTVTAPPGAGQVRTSTDNMTMWLHKIDTEGYDRAAQFTMLTAGVQIAMRSTNGRTVNFRSTGQPTDNGTYYTIPITLVSGTNDFKGVRVEITLRTGIWATDTPP